MTETVSNTTGRPPEKLIHIADLHFWKLIWNPLKLMNKRFLGNLNVWLKRRREFQMHLAEDFADAAAATGITTVVLTGDFTSTATDAEFRLARAFVEGLARRGLQVHLVPGNHDVYTFESERTRRFEKHLGAFIPEHGYPSRVTLPNGTPLLLLPTVSANYLSAKGRIRKREIEAALQLIHGCPPGPILVAAHYPVLPKTHGYTSSPDRQLRNWEHLRDALGNSGRQLLYMAGHVHRFSYTADPNFPGVEYLTTPALFMRRHGHVERGAFSEIHLDDAGFHVYRHGYAEEWIREKTQRQ
ncbi:MAG: metallophosphoesterase [Candidatus Hydrogenedentes bacterium]|nr:metallophosphoesterase [Candidatus Hydrogenedentota bacterium]